MPHFTHKIDTYVDNFKEVSFCRVCGLEDFELEKECSGKFVDKTVDKKEERS